MSKKIYLIDGNSFIYRMFFALPEFSTKEGRVVNATFGMAKFFVGQLVKEKPDYVIFIKDAKWENFRHKLYNEYKATRERMPDNLRSQISDIEEMITRMNIDIIEIPGYEADDVIGTLAVDLGKNSENEIYILTGDKDLYALVNEQVKIYDTQRKKISGPEETYEKFWVPPSCVRDYLAICWDSSDNIPGISGIGPKKATVLLNHYWSVDTMYESIDNLENEYDTLPEEVQKILKGKTLEKFINGKENAFLSQKLATLACDVSLPDFDLHDYSFDEKKIRTPELHDLFRELEFNSLLGDEKPEMNSWKTLWKKVQIIWDSQWLWTLKEEIQKKKEIVLDTETSGLNPRTAELIWVSILLDEESIYYINLSHRWPQVDFYELQKFIWDLLVSGITIIGHNLKYDLQILETFLAKDTEYITRSSQAIDWQTALEI